MILVLCIFTTAVAISQRLALNYYSTGTGQNITANYAWNLKKSELGIGLGYTLSRLTHPDNQRNVYYKRQFATEPVHHLNMNFFYHRYIFQKLEYINLFLFYDFQAKHSAAMNQLDPSSDERIYHGPYYWLDNNMGFGFNVKIAGKWYLQQKIGAGAHFIIPSGKSASRVNTVTGIDKFEWEFIGLLNAGIVYRLK